MVLTYLSVMSIKHRIIRFFILSAIGLALGAAIAGISILSEKQDKGSSSIVSTGIGGPFTLVDQDGKTVTEKDFAGKYMLIYFGFTSCPAICPTELQKIAEVYKSLPKESQNRIQPVFISVDPERDTPKVLKNYVDLFMPELIGLTGSVEQIDAVKKAYKIYAGKVPEGDSYTMDHSSFIYFMGLDAQVIGIFKTSDKPADIKTRIMEMHGLD